MSFEGQVLCQRMLIGPWALTMAGAATVAAAPAAATFKKRRRVEVLSLVGAVMVFSPLDAALGAAALIYWPRDKGLRGCLASLFLMAARHATPRRGLRRASIWRASCFIPGHIKFLLAIGA